MIAILGTGKMGEALLSGLLRAGRSQAEVAAAQEVIVSPEAGGNVKVTLRRDNVPQPPAGRKML